MLDILFDKIYVVWGKDELKREWVSSQFKKLNIENYEFVKSITPKDLIRDKETRFNFIKQKWVMKPCEHLDTNIPMSVGEVCCAYGHLNVYKKAIKDNINKFLIVEDDIKFNFELCDSVFDWKEYLPQTWDIIHFHSWRDNNHLYNKYRKKINSFVYKGYREHSGATCYALTRDTAKMLLTMFYPIHTAADGVSGSLTNTSYARKFYKGYVFYPYIIDGTVFDSQIKEEEQYETIYSTREQRYQKTNFVQ